MSENVALSSKQRRAVTAILSHATIRAAAASVGVTEKTLGRWLAEPAFVAAVRSAESELIAEASRALLQLATKAIRELERVLDDPEASQSARLRAADIALGRLLELRSAHDIEQRLAAIEQGTGAIAASLVDYRGGITEPAGEG